MLCHLLVFSGYVFPFGHVIGPLVLWLMKKDELPEVDYHGCEAVNFQISMTIYVFVAALLCLVLIGIPILIGLVIFDLVVIIIAAVKANDGKRYRYPLCIRFFKPRAVG